MNDIRCYNDRSHKTENGNRGECYHLLFCVDGKTIYCRCPKCKQLWKIDLDDGIPTMTKLPKNYRINYDSTFKMVF